MTNCQSREKKRKDQQQFDLFVLYLEFTISILSHIASPISHFFLPVASESSLKCLKMLLMQHCKFAYIINKTTHETHFARSASWLCVCVCVCVSLPSLASSFIIVVNRSTTLSLLTMWFSCFHWILHYCSMEKTIRDYGLAMFNKVVYIIKLYNTVWMSFEEIRDIHNGHTLSFSCVLHSHTVSRIIQHFCSARYWKQIIAIIGQPNRPTNLPSIAMLILSLLNWNERAKRAHAHTLIKELWEEAQHDE